MNRTILLLGAAFALGTPALAQDAATQAPAASTQMTQQIPAEQFVQMAAISNMFEIQSSMIAESGAEAEEVKSFAEQMIKDHTKAGEELAAAADTAPPETLDAKHQAMVEELQGLKGAELDSKYVEMQVAAHEEAVALFTAYSQNGDDEDLKAFATKTLPVLEQHREHITKIAESVKTG
jgi:putative membrane protein